jgi:hypothetical protein
MRDKLIALLIFIFFLWGFTQILRYSYLVWFQRDEYLQQIKNDPLGWQKHTGFIANFRSSPYFLIFSRIVISFVFLLSIPIFIIVLWSVLVTWFR